MLKYFISSANVYSFYLNNNKNKGSVQSSIYSLVGQIKGRLVGIGEVHEVGI